MVEVVCNKCERVESRALINRSPSCDFLEDIANKYTGGSGESVVAKTPIWLLNGGE